MNFTDFMLFHEALSMSDEGLSISKDDSGETYCDFEFRGMPFRVTLSLRKGRLVPMWTHGENAEADFIPNVVGIAFKGPKGYSTSKVAGSASSAIYSKMLGCVKKVLDNMDVNAITFNAAEPGMYVMYNLFYRNYLMPDPPAGKGFLKIDNLGVNGMNGRDHQMYVSKEYIQQHKEQFPEQKYLWKRMIVTAHKNTKLELEKVELEKAINRINKRNLPSDQAKLAELTHKLESLKQEILKYNDAVRDERDKLRDERTARDEAERRRQQAERDEEYRREQEHIQRIRAERDLESQRDAEHIEVSSGLEAMTNKVLLAGELADPRSLSALGFDPAVYKWIAFVSVPGRRTGHSADDTMMDVVLGDNDPNRTQHMVRRKSISLRNASKLAPQLRPATIGELNNIATRTHYAMQNSEARYQWGKTWAAELKDAPKALQDAFGGLTLTDKAVNAAKGVASIPGQIANYYFPGKQQPRQTRTSGIWDTW
jgi:hypothetical protein